MLVFKQTDRDNVHLWSLVRTRTRKHAISCSCQSSPYSPNRRLRALVFFLLGFIFPRGSDGRGAHQVLTHSTVRNLTDVCRRASRTRCSWALFEGSRKQNSVRQLQIPRGGVLDDVRNVHQKYTVRVRKLKQIPSLGQIHMLGQKKFHILIFSDPTYPNSEAKSEPPNRLSEASENTRPTREDSDIGLQLWCLLHTSTTCFATHSPRRSATAMTYQLSRVTTQSRYISRPQGDKCITFSFSLPVYFGGI